MVIGRELAKLLKDFVDKIKIYVITEDLRRKNE
jgi:hypothetical protein